MKNFFTFILTIIFVGNFLSVAQAKIETFEGNGAYPIAYNKNHGEVKEFAKREAVRDALEKIGGVIYNDIQDKITAATKNDIKVTAGSIVKILSDNYNFVQATGYDGIGICKATVTVSIDTDEFDTKLMALLRNNSTQTPSLVERYEEVQKLNLSTTKRTRELEKQLADKNSAKNIQQIKNEIVEIDKDTLYAQKIAEGWRFWSSGIPTQVTQAVKFFDDAVNLNPNYYHGYLGRGIAYNYLGNYEQALKDFDKAIELNPNFAAIYNNRGEAYEHLGNYTQAIADYAKAIEMNDYAAYYNLDALLRKS